MRASWEAILTRSRPPCKELSGCITDTHHGLDRHWAESDGTVEEGRALDAIFRLCFSYDMGRCPFTIPMLSALATLLELSHLPLVRNVPVQSLFDCVRLQGEGSPFPRMAVQSVAQGVGPRDP